MSLVDKYPNLSHKHFGIAKGKYDRIELLEMAGRENMSANDFYGYIYPENGRKVQQPFWRVLDDTTNHIIRYHNEMKANPTGIQENKKNAKALLREARGLVEFLEEALS